MDIDEIQTLWKEDSQIDDDNLHGESTRIPALHAKYYQILNKMILLKKMEETKFKISRKEKWQYYTGKADPDLIKISSKIEYYQVMINFLDSILKTINNRTHQIKNAIEWQKFIRGYD